MILCITEKPTVATDIAKILGASTRRNGYYEGNGYWVTWTYGHLCELKEPADYRPDWTRWSLAALPMIPNRFGIKLKDQKRIQDQFEVIRTLIGKCDEVINCGDAGQEGELIQRWVMQKAECGKPVKRLWISSLTDDSIREGFKHLKPHEDLQPLYTAGLCRAIGDWLLGINATRLYTLKYRPRRTGESFNQPLSIGRVQTPTLALVVNRQRDIENFVPSVTWELKTKYRDVLFSSTKSFKTEDQGLPLMEQLKHYPFVVNDITKKKGKEAPPRLFDLTSLQVECNRKFSMSADQTLRTIQSLYEKKVATYPRVDTTYLTDDIYPKCGSILNSLTQYTSLLDDLRGKKLRKSNKVFDNSKVTDHHAIIPTGQSLPSSITPDEAKVFDLIARRFISVFYPDCSFEQTVVNGRVDKIDFKATGKVITDPGWHKVYESDSKKKDLQNTSDNDDNPSDEQIDKILPEFTVGESGEHHPMLSKKTTSPPKYYTEGTLLKAMETAGAGIDDEDLREALKANGIGRPSTRAAIIETLFKRGYIIRERKSLRATQSGIDLIDLIKDDLLKSAKLTGIWEKRLREIEAGTYNAQLFINQMKQMIIDITRMVIQDNSDRVIEADTPQETTKTRKKKK